MRGTASDYEVFEAEWLVWAAWRAVGIAYKESGTQRLLASSRSSERISQRWPCLRN
jgi:hypothetical protein